MLSKGGSTKITRGLGRSIRVEGGRGEQGRKSDSGTLETRRELLLLWWEGRK